MGRLPSGISGLEQAAMVDTVGIVVEPSPVAPMRRPQPGSRRLGDLLVADGLISGEQLARALAAQKGTTEKLGSILLKLNFIQEDQLIGFLSRHRAIEILSFVVLYKFADQLAQALTRPFLIDMGYNATDRGIALATVGLTATIAGGFVGGWITTLIGLGHALWMFGVLQIFSNLGYFFVARAAGPSLPLMFGAVGFEALKLVGGYYLTLISGSVTAPSRRTRPARNSPRRSRPIAPARSSQIPGRPFA